MKFERPLQEKADFNSLLKAIRRENAGGPVPIIELDINPDIMANVLETKKW